MSKIDIGISIFDWIDFNKNVGVEMLHISGLPGWGKTSMANTLILECAERKENWVLPGDRFCEWRHFHKYKNYFYEIIIIVPRGFEIYYYGEKLIEWKEKRKEGIRFIEKDYSKLDVMDYLPEDKKTRLIVIYDSHLRIGDRAWLWVNISQQLLNRITHLGGKAIGVLFNEAGIYFPQNAQGEHWKAVSEFSSLIVDARKGLVRYIFISQMQNEVESTIRKKCMFRAFRKGWPSKDEPKPIRKSAPFMARNQFHLSIGGLYVQNNLIDKFIEENQTMKMIPIRSLINDSGGLSGNVTGKDEKKVVSSILVERKARWDHRYSLIKPIKQLDVQEGEILRFRIEKLASVSEK